MRYISSNNSPLSKKRKRHSGWKQAFSTINMPRQWIIDNCLEPPIYYDDWEDWRDGMRDTRRDWKKIKKIPIAWYWGEGKYNRWYFNNKQKKLLKRRKARCR